MNEEEVGYRNKLIDDQLKLALELDKKIVWIAAGAIGLSITFLKDILKVEILLCQSLLIMSWALMALTLILALVNNMLGVVAYKDMLVKFDRQITTQQIAKGSIYASAINLMNWANIFLIASSLVFLILFSYQNLIK